MRRLQERLPDASSFILNSSPLASTMLKASLRVALFQPQRTNMSLDLVDISDLEANELQGQSNYMDWRKHFDRTARLLDLWGLLTGTEKLEQKPTVADFFIKDGELTDRDAIIARLSWKLAYEEWKTQRDKLGLARRLIYRSVCSAIIAEVEDLPSPIEMVNFIKNRYMTSPQHDQNVLLVRVSNLRLTPEMSMAKYLNRHRELKFDLLRCGYDYDNSMLVTSILFGLPGTYSDFRQLWDLHDEADPDTEPDTESLCTRLIKQERRLAARVKQRKSKGGSGFSSNSYRSI